MGGPGGEAYAGYDAWVQAVYYEAWQVESDVADDDSVVRVKVTIARDGRVLDSRIVGRSGSAIVDRIGPTRARQSETRGHRAPLP